MIKYRAQDMGPAAVIAVSALIPRDLFDGLSCIRKILLFFHKHNWFTDPTNQIYG